MTVRAKIVASIGGVLIWLGAARLSAAADQEATLQQITALNKAAIAAYSAGDFDKSKDQLLQAVAAANKDPELQTHPLMARTYLHLGVVYVDGLEDNAGGIAYFVKALKIRPDIEVTQALATKTVKSAFDQAKGQAGATPAVATAASASAPKEAAVAPPGTATPTQVQEKPTPKMTVADKKKAAAEEKQAAAEEKNKDRQARADKEKLTKDAAQAQANETKERAAKEKLLAEKTDKEKQLAESKAAHDQLQKEAKEKEKQAQTEKDRLSKDLVQAKDSEAKERAAKEKLLAEKTDKEKQLADAKASILQLQKEKAEKEKLLGESLAREKAEREAKEKLEKEKQLAEAREKDRKSNEDKERVNREKVAAGPDLPAHFASPIYCAIPDEAQTGVDLFVHCVAQANLKDKEIAFYYRPSGGSHYNSLALEPSKKGWHAAMVPAEHVTGKVLQYYVEVRDRQGAVAAANGKPNSPNILSLKPSGATANRSAVKVKVSTLRPVPR
jgi:hypothetical protein